MNGSSFHRCKLNIYHYHRYPLILKRKHRVKTGCWCQKEYSKWIILCQLNRYQKATRSWSSFQQYAFSTSVTRNRTWCQCLVSYNIYVAFCAIWYHLYNLKNLKNSHGGVLLLVNFTKSNTPPWVFFTFLKLYKWYQIAQSVTYYVMRSFKISLKRARKTSFIKTKILLYNKVGNYLLLGQLKKQCVQNIGRGLSNSVVVWRRVLSYMHTSARANLYRWGVGTI